MLRHSQDAVVPLDALQKQITAIDKQIKRFKKMLVVEEKDTLELEQKTEVIKDKEWLTKKKNAFLAMNFATQSYAKEIIPEYAATFIQFGITDFLERKEKTSFIMELLTKLGKDAHNDHNDAGPMIATLEFIEQVIVELFRQEELILFLSVSSSDSHESEEKKPPSQVFIQLYIKFYAYLTDYYLDSFEKSKHYFHVGRMHFIYQAFQQEKYAAADGLLEHPEVYLSPIVRKGLLSKLIDAKVFALIKDIPKQVEVQSGLALMKTANQQFIAGKSEEALASFGVSFSFFYSLKNVADYSQVKQIYPMLFSLVLDALQTRLAKFPQSISLKEAEVNFLVASKLVMTALVVIESDLLFNRIQMTKGKKQAADQEIGDLCCYMGDFYKSLSQYLQKKQAVLKGDFSAEEKASLQKQKAVKFLLAGQNHLLNEKYDCAFEAFQKSYAEDNSPLVGLFKTRVENIFVANLKALESEKTKLTLEKDRLKSCADLLREEEQAEKQSKKNKNKPSAVNKKAVVTKMPEETVKVEAAAKAKAAEAVRAETEAKAKSGEEAARIEAEAKAKAAEVARVEAETKTKVAEETARTEVEAKTKVEKVAKAVVAAQESKSTTQNSIFLPGLFQPQVPLFIPREIKIKIALFKEKKSSTADTTQLHNWLKDSFNKGKREYNSVAFYLSSEFTSLFPNAKQGLEKYHGWITQLMNTPPQIVYRERSKEGYKEYVIDDPLACLYFGMTIAQVAVEKKSAETMLDTNIPELLESKCGFFANEYIFGDRTTSLSAKLKGLLPYLLQSWVESQAKVQQEQLSASGW